MPHMEPDIDGVSVEKVVAQLQKVTRQRDILKLALMRLLNSLELVEIKMLKNALKDADG